ncbi:hypothetical protein EDC39_10332 [Geothermobacter ehrlichii]|uniref:LbtU family siderophore porin n=1 Tax=Geothermobacter ehrlichii TaxID=213224 RepID=A0A5D3WKK1_9BACT|nr:LbtU family siderophore porin [Geothermobacter ehrlichii]TYO99190.1 hypothetical protein EDC39_10332 [Geothermobacter ehrlichii]
MKRILSLATFLLIISTLPALAAHPDTKSEIESLKERIRSLESRLGEEQEPAEEAPFTLSALGKHLSIGGLLELEASLEKTEGETENSDLTLATAQLSLETEINENLGGHVILLYEEDPDNPDDETLKVDEAVISLACPNRLAGMTPTLQAGKLYLPFGNFNSHLISDPLTLELGETSDTAAIFGLEGETTNLSLGVFNGAVDTDNDSIDTVVVSATFQPEETFGFGLSWISDLAESDNGLVADKTLYGSAVPAAAAYLSAVFGQFDFEAEILGALDNFDRPLVGLSELTGNRPLAWNLEAAWMPNDRTQLAVRAEGARDFQDDVRRYGIAGSYGIFPHAVLALEYLYADPDAEAKSHSLTGQLAFEF